MLVLDIYIWLEKKINLIRIMYMWEVYMYFILTEVHKNFLLIHNSYIYIDLIWMLLEHD